MYVDRELGEALFSQRLRQIEGTIERVARRHRLAFDESQELYGEVMLKVVGGDFAVLRRFEGRSSWSSYLNVVIERELLDRRVRKWGRWRPSAVARRLGATAIELETRINRDGLEPHQAVEELASRGEESSDRLEELAAQIPRRSRRRLVSADSEVDVGKLAGSEAAEALVEAAEHRKVVAELRDALAQALLELTEEERELIRARFARGLTVRRIASSFEVDERPLYRCFERLLGQLRARLEGAGLGWREIALALDSQDGVELAVLRSQPPV